MKKCNKRLRPAAEYARLRGLNRSTVSRQIREGKIRSHGGLVDPIEADEDRRRNIDVRKQHRREPSLSSIVPLPLEPAGSNDPRAYRRLLDRILSKRNLVPEILLALGARDPAVLIHASAEIFAFLVLEFSGVRDTVYPVDTDDIPLLPDPDFKALTTRYGMQFAPETVETADKLAEACYGPAIKKIIAENAK